MTADPAAFNFLATRQSSPAKLFVGPVPERAELVEILRKYGIAAPVAGATTADILSQYGPQAPQE